MEISTLIVIVLQLIQLAMQISDRYIITITKRHRIVQRSVHIPANANRNHNRRAPFEL